MDVGSKAGYPANELSNFSPGRFWFDGVECNSREGLIQAFKQKNHAVQVEMCKLVGFAAKRRGSKLNWKTTQTLWWKGVAFPRKSEEYMNLIELLYLSVTRDCDSFRRALLASGNANLTHSIGKSKESETVLTIREFCGNLTKMRRHLQLGTDLDAEISRCSDALHAYLARSRKDTAEED